MIKKAAGYIGNAGSILFVWLTLHFVAPASATTYNISMTADGFDPSYLEVTVGDSVYWWNEDYDYYDDHSTRSYSYPWSSGAIPVGYGVRLNTTKTGSYDYTDDWGFSGWGTLVIKPAGPPPPPPPTVISAPSRVDMVYDGPRDILYITSGSSVLRYQLESDSFLSPFELGGDLKGVDISPDNNTLIVADSSVTSNVWVHVIDLNSGESKKAFFPASYREKGTFAVAFGSDGAALITSRFNGSGFVPLRRYDPVSGSTKTIDTVQEDSMVSCTGDGALIVIAESNSSGGPFDRYDVARQAITKRGGDGWYNYECAANRDGSLFAVPTYNGTYIYDGDFNQVTKIGAYAGEQPIGAAFHASANVVFFAFAKTAYVRAYSTDSWQMLGQYDFQSTFTAPANHAFDNGRVRLSRDGQVVFATVSGGVGYVRHALSLPATDRLIVAGNPVPYGAPTSLPYGSYWLPHGTNLTLSVPTFAQSNGASFFCAGWTGTGSAPGSGSSTTVNFTLTTNSTVTWNWTPLVVSANVDLQSSQHIILQWPSVDGLSFDVEFSPDLLSGFTPVATDLPATPPVNSYQGDTSATTAGYYRVKMK